jgi:hypothetical protein
MDRVFSQAVVRRSMTQSWSRSRTMIGRPRYVLLSVLLGLLLGGSSTGEEPPPLERVGVIALKGPVGGLDHMALDAKRKRLFVANTVNGSLDIVDLEAGKLLDQIRGQTRIRGIDYSPDLDRVFVGNGTDGICNVFDGDSYQLVKSLPLGDDADNVRYNARTRRLYVVHADSELAVIGVDNYTVLDPIKLERSLGALQAGVIPAEDVRERQGGGAGRGDRRREGPGHRPVPGGARSRQRLIGDRRAESAAVHRLSPRAGTCGHGQ